jgi:hypothetical protein
MGRLEYVQIAPRLKRVLERRAALVHDRQAHRAITRVDQHKHFHRRASWHTSMVL